MFYLINKQHWAERGDPTDKLKNYKNKHSFCNFKTYQEVAAKSYLLKITSFILEWLKF